MASLLAVVATSVTAGPVEFFLSVATTKVLDCLGSPRLEEIFPRLVLEGRPKARVLGEPTFDKYGGSLGTQIIRWDLRRGTQLRDIDLLQVWVHSLST